MIDSQDVREQELEVLSGDVMINNLYRSKQIVNTLIFLCEIDKNGWTKELEDQLCTLRDLSTKRKVVSHLMFHDFPKIAKKALVITNKPRLTEIILGIIGNLCSSDEVCDMIGRDRELVTQILSCLGSNDSLILIQLMRILKLVAEHIEENHQSNWIAHLTKCKFFGDSIISILKNSTNADVLTDVMGLLDILCRLLWENKKWEKFWVKSFKVNDFIPAMFKSFMQVISTTKRSCFEWQFADYWLRCLLAMGRDSPHCIIPLEIYTETEERFLELMEIIYRILEPCKKSCNLLYPIRKLGAYMIYRSTCIMINLCYIEKNEIARINSILATITFSLKTVSVSDSRKELDPDERTVELLNYMNGHWLHMIEYRTGEQIAEILRLCERDVCEYLISAVQSHPEVTPETLDKMIAAISLSLTLSDLEQ